MPAIIRRCKTLLSCLGPGLLMAGAAVGVSHLVQSTRAGADFGWGLLIFILLANILKYPFFEYGHRFASATGKSLLEGYKHLGKGYLAVFLLANVFSAIISIAAVVFVGAALLGNLFPFDISLEIWAAILMAFCFTLIAVGEYRFLDLFMKIMMSVLVVCTLTSFFFAAQNTPSLHLQSFSNIASLKAIHLPFLIALMGWMPAPVEISVWQSLWVVEKNKCCKNPFGVTEAKLDFNFGYVLTVILAIMFCGLGALTMYGTGASFSNAPATFASQVIELYTSNIGDWAKPLIAITAFTTMFSTALTLIDAYPRSISEGLLLFFPKPENKHKFYHLLAVFICCSLSGVVVLAFLNSLKALVDTVTIIAFLAAPLFGYLNFKLIRSKIIPKNHRPGKIMIIWSYLGLAFLCFFGILFLSSLAL